MGQLWIFLMHPLQDPRMLAVYLSGSTRQIKYCYFRPPRSAGQHPLKKQGLLYFFLYYTPPSAACPASVTLPIPGMRTPLLATWQPATRVSGYVLKKASPA
jgi:hypothetical protein